METRRLGRTGLDVSLLTFGCGAVGGLMTAGRAADQDRAVAWARDNGINHFDTAPLYGKGASEENLGRALGRDRDGLGDLAVPKELQRGVRAGGAAGQGHHDIQGETCAAGKRLGRRLGHRGRQARHGQDRPRSGRRACGKYVARGGSLAPDWRAPG